MNIPDIHIWQGFLKGDKSALEQLMKLHYKAIFNFGLKYTTDVELVKDCIQELFMTLWDRRSRLSINVNPRAYLIASLRRNLHRKIQSESRIYKYYDKAMALDLFDFELSIEEKIINSESLLLLTKRMNEVVATLPKRQKEVIYLKFFQNLKRDEIAKIMGNNPQTVSNLLQMAIKKLRVDFSCPILILLSSLAVSFFLVCIRQTTW